MINLDEIEKKIDECLNNETPGSLKKWLEDYRATHIVNTPISDSAFVITDVKGNIEAVSLSEPEADSYCVQSNMDKENRKDFIGYKKVDLI